MTSSGALFARATLIALLSFPVFPASAADLEPTTFWKRYKEKGLYERVWELFRLYENESNSVVQAVSIVGRYHGQYWGVDSAQGSEDGWENRRVFLGAEALLLDQFTVQAQIRISEDFDPFYDGLFQAFIKWEPDDLPSVDVGRVDFLLAGLERSTSSTRMATFERGLLVNQLMPGEVVGIVAEGHPGRFHYRAGMFSGSIDQEFTTFEGGFGALAGIGFDLPLIYKTGVLHLDYVFNNGDPLNNAFKPYDHILSLWHEGEVGPASIGVDLTWANGLENRPAVLGITVLPTWVVTTNIMRPEDSLQMVARYQFATSDDDNGLQLQSRYEQEVVPDGFGNRYHALYAGLNYLIFSHRLKLMSGVEYAVMDDAANDGGAFDGWTYLAGVRVFF